MSKYVIEIEEKPLCVFDKDTQTFFPRLWRVKGFNSLVLDEEGLSRLEELNSDYINEHFSDLQDAAYQRGLEDGKEYGLDESDMREAVSYQRGLEDGKVVNDKVCEGCEYEEVIGDKCRFCANRYPNQWTEKQDDKIEVRDEVVWTEDENVVIVVTSVYTADNMEWCDGVCKDGKVYSILTKNARKTGRRFDISKILEDMSHD